MKFNKIIAVVFVSLAFAVLLFLTKKEEPLSRTEFKLNTVVSVTIYDSQNEEILNHCFEICDEYEKIFSRTDTESELYQLNHGILKKDAEGRMRITAPLFQLIQDGLKYEKISEGSFSVLVEPVSSLWNFSEGDKLIPENAEIQKAIPFVDSSFVQLMKPDLISLEESAGIDLGATAKGFIAEEIKNYLLSEQIHSAIISLGGNIVCIGDKNGDPFQIGIKKPFGENTEVLGSIEVKDLSVVSSGVYERCFEKDGKFYHHILNPKTGYPYENDIVGVSIVCKDSYLADIYSTLSLTMGSEKAIRFLNQSEEADGLVLRKDGEILFSEGFKEKYKFKEQ